MSRTPAILIVDDRRNMVRLMAKVLQCHATIHTAYEGSTAIEVLKRERLDAVLCDLKLPGVDGIGVLRACKRYQPAARFVLMTAYATVETAVDALRLGAHDYLVKPFEPQQATRVLLRALALPDESRDGAADEVLPGVLSRNRAMRDLARLVSRVAGTNSSVLFLGEVGSGRESLARAVHQLSPGAAGRFVVVDCSMASDEVLDRLAESLTDGRELRGSDPVSRLFDAAAGATLFFEEIAELSHHMQGSLVRQLASLGAQSGKGDPNARAPRVLASSRVKLEARIEAGRFRRELWYRLGSTLIRVPPLRDRPEDIPLLASRILARLETASGGGVKSLSDDALVALQTFSWPGNVPQLRAALEHANARASSGRIEAGDFAREVVEALPPEEGAPALADLSWTAAKARGKLDVARTYLDAILRRFEGNVPEAAAHAEVERESFYRLLRRYGLEPEAYRRGDS